MLKANIIVIGAGISGAVLAERYAHMGKTVLVVEQRPHIAGNCYDYTNSAGLRISKYGAHLFHTDDQQVWDYLQQFSNWYPYEHRVLASVDSKLVPVPVNITTVNCLLGLNITNEEQMRQWLAANTIPNPNPQDGEEAALARVGPDLYEKIFKHYTKKQWDKYPAELDASVLNRIPVRTNFDDRYFSDRYQALPTHGYTAIFERMLEHPKIQLLLNTDFFEIKDQLQGYEKLFYTGPIDRFFDYRLLNQPKLEYRSINFVEETHDQPYYQSAAVINYPNDFDFTRIVEYKHITGQQSERTTIVKEFTTDEGEPYYPVPNPRNHELYSEYKTLADRYPNVFFVGRLANYKYFNMDEAFKNALQLFERLEGTNI